MRKNVRMGEALYKYLFTLLMVIGACTEPSENSIDIEEPPKEPATVSVTYEETFDDFVNPERGFYRHTSTTGSNKLSKSTLQGYRASHKPSGSQYNVQSSIILRLFYLSDFKNKDISNAYLKLIQDDFNTARDAGVKMILRFAYTSSTKSGNCPESWICTPYGDAPKDKVLRHIEQLKPLIQENADVIFCIQMGFIGVWGEHYYTDYFGDASTNGNGKLLDENWQDRIDVINALLEATPESIMIQVRTPQTKQRVVYGIKATVTEAKPLEAMEAFNATAKARIGHHNDCLLASLDDYGTFEDYGNSTSPRLSSNDELRDYTMKDSKYVVVGGETCNGAYNPENDCAPDGKADTELREYHYSYLNADYNNDVNNEWVTGGCMDAIRRNLGYRLVLREAFFAEEIVKEKFYVGFKVENVGYASPVKDRPVLLVLKNSETGKAYSFAFDTEIQTWHSGDHKVSTYFDFSSLPAGNYDLYLHLPDASESIAERVEYAIRLANKNLWDGVTGYNKLNYSIQLP
jgi:hypothetical protein